MLRALTKPIPEQGAPIKMDTLLDLDVLPHQAVVKCAVMDCYENLRGVKKIVMFENVAYQQQMMQWIYRPNANVPYDQMLKMIAITQAYGVRYTHVGYTVPWKSEPVIVGTRADCWDHKVVAELTIARGATWDAPPKKKAAAASA